MAMWILVGDEATARLFEADDNARNWREAKTFSHPESRLKADQMYSDRPSSPESGMPRREFEGTRFAKEVANYLDTHQNDFQRLVLVGPPRFLGLLRKDLSNPVAKKLSDSLPKELTQLNERELQDRISVELML